MAYFEQFRQLDGSVLYSGTIAATGAGASISVQYFQSVSVQVTGSGYINATIEGSNDGTNWNTILLTPSNDLAVTDTITQIGGYNFKSPFLYIRYNIAEYNGTQTLTIVGRSGAGESGADKLAAAFNPDTPLQVNLTGGLKRDATGALILSEAYYTIGPGAPANETITLDVSGYNSWTFLSAGSGGSSTNILFSADGVFFQSSSDYSNPSNNGGGLQGNISSGGGIYNGPIYGKYMRFTTQANFFGTFIFKQTPPTLNSVNLRSIGGSVTVNAGVGGTLAVGGNIAVGAAPTLNPLTVGGSDLNGLTRRLLTDVSGKTFFNALSPYFAPLANNTSTVISSSNSPGANTSLPINTVGALPATFQQSAALNVQDTSQFEGQTQTELLAQILLELKIMNQQMYELPRLLSTNQQSADPPEAFRAEQSIFNQ